MSRMSTVRADPFALWTLRAYQHPVCLDVPLYQIREPFDLVATVQQVKSIGYGSGMLARHGEFRDYWYTDLQAWMRERGMLVLHYEQHYEDGRVEPRIIRA